ncbi:hypothetical protein [Ferroglobus sp.]|uniref:hypothetical protein n=1 Tax=Ferroglobus sp. TaxID=2614230 RepID=UPI0025C65D60|nr:hypothetical protein [Ferroglobus sp.]
MEAEIVTVPGTKAAIVNRLLQKKFERIKFKPDFALIFITSRLYGEHKHVLDFIKNSLKCRSAAFFIEGYGGEEGTWAQGVAIALFSGDVGIFQTGKGHIIEELESVGRKLRSYDAAMAIYPLSYFPSRFDLLKFIREERKHSSEYGKCENNECKEKVLTSFSEYLIENRLIMPANEVMKALSVAEIPVAGINLFPMEARFDTPKIFKDYNEIGRNALVLGFKNAKVHFHEIYPERGKSFEETLEILKSVLQVKEVTSVVKKGVAIGEVGGMKVVDYARKFMYMEEMTEEKFVSGIERGEIITYSPYALAFVSKETHGVAGLGIANVPVSIYPSVFSLDIFYDECVMVGEIFRGGIQKFAEVKDLKTDARVRFYFIDANTILAFRGNIDEITNAIKAEEIKGTEWLVLYVTPPSAYLPLKSKNYLSEINKDIMYFGSGTNLLFEIK